jgi:hypothetical protein
MYDEITLSTLPTSERLLAEDTDTPPLSQITQEVLQSVSYRLRDAEIDPRDLPSTDSLLAEDTDIPPLSQITQEVLQSVSYRLRNA